VTPSQAGTSGEDGAATRQVTKDRRQKLHRRVTIFLQVLLVLGSVMAGLQGRWLPALSSLAIVAVTIVPFVVGRRFHIFVPPEFEALAVVFIYASLLLGEVQGYYLRFWWWDALLHAGSGFLLGITGFLLAHVLNQHKEIEFHLKPGFVALFAFMFAMGTGGLWEIFEFGMDQVFGLNMQKSGIVDTMWDLIVDAIGGLTISLLGWSYLRTRGNDSFLERWIDAFIESNPRMFRGSVGRKVDHG